MTEPEFDTSIVERVPARVGILGNPSDGYGGRTLAMTISEFEATVTLEPHDRLEIEPADGGRGWVSVRELVADIDRHGYGDGRNLLAAAVRTFFDVVAVDGGRSKTDGSKEDPIGVRSLSLLKDSNEAVSDSIGNSNDFEASSFRLTYETTIPRQVGLAGSSALIIACLRCLCRHTSTELPSDILATIALRVETEQLGITAGLQDRVVQSFGGLVAMDFGQMTTDPRFGVAVGRYTQLDPGNLPPLFVSYRAEAAEHSDVYHRELRRKYDNGDATTRDTLRQLAALVVEGEAALRWGDSEKLAQLIGKNMRLRRSLAPLSEQQLELVDAATGLDAQSTFTGSGGAIVGAYRDDDHFDLVSSTLDRLGAFTLKLR